MSNQTVVLPITDSKFAGSSMDRQLEPPLNSHIAKKERWRQTLLFSFQSFGIIYGRMSIAPLYVFGTFIRENIESHTTLYEYFSFIFWTMTIIPLMKYAFILLKADDNGEGGTFALYSLLCRHSRVGLLPNDRSEEFINYETKGSSKRKSNSRAIRAIEKHKKGSHYCMLFMALFGSCMIIADGVFTPAISVLSASSGLQRLLSDFSKNFFSSQSTQKSVSKALENYVPVPAACAILICLFMLQHYGSHRIGFIFAPFVIIWIFVISGVGIYNVFHWNPKILYGISPSYMYKFLRKMDIKSWRSLCSILLCVAGSEAMFADLGHFSKKSIMMAFVCFIYPALILCYAGQAAFMSSNMHASDDVIHLSESIPGPLSHVFIVLSLIVSAIGSQATITACFSIINQCVAVGCFPRVKVVHTSDKICGQIYIPDINWLLMVLNIGITIGFHDVNRIGNAMGLATVSGMLVTTCLMSLVIVVYWGKNLLLSACFLVFFSPMEIMYLSACMLNFHKGAWCLVFLVVVFLTIMVAWHYGTLKKYELDFQNKVPMDWLNTDFGRSLGVSRVPGIGFIHTDILTGIPAFFSHFVTNLPAFHQILIFVSFKPSATPHLPPSQRYLIGRVGPKNYKFYRCIVRYGYRDCVRDMGDFEDQIIRSIGGFISAEEHNVESLAFPEGKMIVVGNPGSDGNGNALVPVNEPQVNLQLPSTLDSERGRRGSIKSDALEGCHSPGRRKKVRFMLPPKSPKLQESVRRELQYLIDARESGTTYLLGQSHLSVANRSNFISQILIRIYVFLDKNCREHPVALDIPHAALVEVGMLYRL